MKASSASGVCKDSSGNTINTHEIFGQWKKVSGYLGGEKSAEELKYNYSVLMVEKGSAICQVSVVNRTAQAVKSTDQEAYVATYSHDINARTLSMTYTAGAAGASSDQAVYSFSGDCSSPKLVLSYPGNSALSQEVFVLQSKNVPEKSCQGGN